MTDFEPIRPSRAYELKVEREGKKLAVTFTPHPPEPLVAYLMNSMGLATRNQSVRFKEDYSELRMTFATKMKEALARQQLPHDIGFVPQTPVDESHIGTQRVCIAKITFVDTDGEKETVNLLAFGRNNATTIGFVNAYAMMCLGKRLKDVTVINNQAAIAKYLWGNELIIADYPAPYGKGINLFDGKLRDARMLLKKAAGAVGGDAAISIQVGSDQAEANNLTDSEAGENNATDSEAGDVNLVDSETDSSTKSGSETEQTQSADYEDSSSTGVEPGEISRVGSDSDGNSSRASEPKSDLSNVETDVADSIEIHGADDDHSQPLNIAGLLEEIRETTRQADAQREKILNEFRTWLATEQANIPTGSIYDYWFDWLAKHYPNYKGVAADWMNTETLETFLYQYYEGYPTILSDSDSTRQPTLIPPERATFEGAVPVAKIAFVMMGMDDYRPANRWIGYSFKQATDLLSQVALATLNPQVVVEWADGAVFRIKLDLTKTFKATAEGLLPYNVGGIIESLVVNLADPSAQLPPFLEESREAAQQLGDHHAYHDLAHATDFKPVLPDLHHHKSKLEFVKLKGGKVAAGDGMAWQVPKHTSWSDANQAYQELANRHESIHLFVKWEGDYWYEPAVPITRDDLTSFGIESLTLSEVLRWSMLRMLTTHQKDKHQGTVERFTELLLRCDLGQGEQIAKSNQEQQIGVKTISVWVGDEAVPASTPAKRFTSWSKADRFLAEQLDTANLARVCLEWEDGRCHEVLIDLAKGIDTNPLTSQLEPDFIYILENHDELGHPAAFVRQLRELIEGYDLGSGASKGPAAKGSRAQLVEAPIFALSSESFGWGSYGPVRESANGLRVDLPFGKENQVAGELYLHRLEGDRWEINAGFRAGMGLDYAKLAGPNSFSGPVEGLRESLRIGLNWFLNRLVTLAEIAEHEEGTLQKLEMVFAAGYRLRQLLRDFELPFEDDAVGRYGLAISNKSPWTAVDYSTDGSIERHSIVAYLSWVSVITIKKLDEGRYQVWVGQEEERPQSIELGTDYVQLTETYASPQAALRAGIIWHLYYFSRPSAVDATGETIKFPWHHQERGLKFLRMYADARKLALRTLDFGHRMVSEREKVHQALVLLWPELEGDVLPQQAEVAIADKGTLRAERMGETAFDRPTQDYELNVERESDGELRDTVRLLVDPFSKEATIISHSKASSGNEEKPAKVALDAAEQRASTLADLIAWARLAIAQRSPEQSKGQVATPLTFDNPLRIPDTRREEIIVPFPKARKFRAKVVIGMVDEADYRVGIDHHLEIGSHSGFGTDPSMVGTIYPNRMAALSYGLVKIKKALESIVAGKTFNETDTNHIPQFKKALADLEKFAEGEGITLSGHSTSAEGELPTDLTDKIPLKEIWLRNTDPDIDEPEGFIYLRSWEDANELLEDLPLRSQVLVELLWEDGHFWNYQLETVEAHEGEQLTGQFAPYLGEVADSVPGEKYSSVFIERADRTLYGYDCGTAVAIEQLNKPTDSVKDHKPFSGGTTEPTTIPVSEVAGLEGDVLPADLSDNIPLKEIWLRNTDPDIDEPEGFIYLRSWEDANELLEELPLRSQVLVELLWEDGHFWNYQLETVEAHEGEQLTGQFAPYLGEVADSAPGEKYSSLFIERADRTLYRYDCGIGVATDFAVNPRNEGATPLKKPAALDLAQHLPEQYRAGDALFSDVFEKLHKLAPGVLGQQPYSIEVVGKSKQGDSTVSLFRRIEFQLCLTIYEHVEKKIRESHLVALDMERSQAQVINTSNSADEHFLNRSDIPLQEAARKQHQRHLTWILSRWLDKVLADGHLAEVVHTGESEPDATDEQVPDMLEVIPEKYLNEANLFSEVYDKLHGLVPELPSKFDGKAKKGKLVQGDKEVVVVVQREPRPSMVVFDYRKGKLYEQHELHLDHQKREAEVVANVTNYNELMDTYADDPDFHDSGGHIALKLTWVFHQWLDNQLTDDSPILLTEKAMSSELPEGELPDMIEAIPVRYHDNQSIFREAFAKLTELSFEVYASQGAQSASSVITNGKGDKVTIDLDWEKAPTVAVITQFKENNYIEDEWNQLEQHTLEIDLAKQHAWVTDLSTSEGNNPLLEKYWLDPSFGQITPDTHLKRTWVFINWLDQLLRLGLQGGTPLPDTPFDLPAAEWGRNSGGFNIFQLSFQRLRRLAPGIEFDLEQGQTTGQSVVGTQRVALDAKVLLERSAGRIKSSIHIDLSELDGTERIRSFRAVLSLDDADLKCTGWHTTDHKEQARFDKQTGTMPDVTRMAFHFAKWLGEMIENGHRIDFKSPTDPGEGDGPQPNDLNPPPELPSEPDGKPPAKHSEGYTKPKYMGGVDNDLDVPLPLDRVIWHTPEIFTAESGFGGWIDVFQLGTEQFKIGVNLSRKDDFDVASHPLTQSNNYRTANEAAQDGLALMHKLMLERFNLADDPEPKLREHYLTGLRELSEFALQYDVRLPVALPDQKPIAEEVPETNKPLEEVTTKFEALYDKGEYGKAASLLLNSLKNVGRQLPLESLPLLLELYLKPHIHTTLEQKHKFVLGDLLTSKDFAGALDRNLWPLLPEKVKRGKKVELIEWEAKADDPGLTALLDPFVLKTLDTLRYEQLGVRFGPEGIFASNSYVALFLRSEWAGENETWCLHKKCWQHLSQAPAKTPIAEMKAQVSATAAKNFKSSQWRDISPVLPDTTQAPATARTSAIHQYLIALEAAKISKADNMAILCIQQVYYPFQASDLKTVVEAMLQLGIAELDIQSDGPEKPAVIAPKGTYWEAIENHAHHAVLVPFSYRNALRGLSIDDAAGRLVFDTSTGTVETIGGSLPKPESWQLTGEKPKEVQSVQVYSENAPAFWTKANGYIADGNHAEAATVVREALRELPSTGNKVGVAYLLRLLNMPEVREELQPDDFGLLNRYIGSEELRSTIGENLWSWIPDEVKLLTPISTVPWKADPEDDGLKMLAAPFVRTTPTDPKDSDYGMIGAYFTGDGIAAVDGHKLLFLHTSHELKEGVYCLTDNCWEMLTGKQGASLQTAIRKLTKSKLEKFRKKPFPRIQKVLGTRATRISTISTSLLREYAHTMQRVPFYSTGNACYLMVGEQLLAGNPAYLLDIANAMLMLGHQQVDVGVSSETEVVRFAPVGNIPLCDELGTTFVILAPMSCPLTAPDRGLLYLDLDTGKHHTFGVTDGRTREAYLEAEKPRKGLVLSMLAAAEWNPTEADDDDEPVHVGKVSYNRNRLNLAVLNILSHFGLRNGIEWATHLRNTFTSISRAGSIAHTLLTKPGTTPTEAQEYLQTLWDDLVYSYSGRSKESEMYADAISLLLHLPEPPVLDAKLLPIFEMAEVHKRETDRPTIYVRGRKLNVERLDKALQELVATLPLPEQETLVMRVADEVGHPTTLEAFSNSLVTAGKKGDQKRQTTIAQYISSIFHFKEATSPLNGPVEATGVAEAFIDEVAEANASMATKDEGKPKVILADLADAYWREEDTADRYKIRIGGVDFHSMRLMKALEALTRKGDPDTLEFLALTLETQVQEWAGENPDLFIQFEHYSDAWEHLSRVQKQSSVWNYFAAVAAEFDLPGAENQPAVSWLVDALANKEDELVALPPLAGISPVQQDEPDEEVEDEKPPILLIPGLQPADLPKDPIKLNQAIEQLIDLRAEEGSSFTEEELDYLRLYTGYGGLVNQGASGPGCLYEYYTPPKLVQRMWGLAMMYGYDGGSVMEPAAGTGNFIEYAPPGAEVVAFEPNKYSATITKALYPDVEVHTAAFETVFFKGNIHQPNKPSIGGFDLVIGNPPYGSFCGKYAGMGEKKSTGMQQYDQYFMVRCMDLLKPGGLLVFLVPHTTMDGGYQKFKERMVSQARLMKLVRLPERVFSRTDIVTDVQVWKKKQPEEVDKAA